MTSKTTEQLDLDALDLSELKLLSKKVDKAIVDFEKRRKEAALDELREVAKRNGLNLNDLQGMLNTSSSKAVAGEPRYRNPDDPDDTWTGRGRRPRWVIDHLEAGVSLKSL